MRERERKRKRKGWRDIGRERMYERERKRKGRRDIGRERMCVGVWEREEKERTVENSERYGSERER